MTPLLTTKLYIPQARPNLVPRPRLIQRLNQGLTGKLTLISAPAGFGKSTLLSEWMPNSERSVAWLSLDEGDNDPIRFWSYFIASLQRLDSNLAENVYLLLQAPQTPPLELLLTHLLNALTAFPQPFALVLDDYHMIENPAIHNGLAFILDHLPPQVHLIITSRVDPPLPLARLRGRAQINEIRAANLRFTSQEATLFLNQVTGLKLSDEQVAALETRTEGWIAGLQLAALAMQNRTDLDSFVNSFTGSNRFVVDYLAAEVFARQPAHLQSFLLQTSILERMCGSLCDAVIGLNEASPAEPQRRSAAEAYSQLLLEELERANLFLVPLDSERGWYRYHHLFAEVMRARLLGGARDETIITLYQRASGWYEQEGLIDEAIRYALAAPDVERAAALIERHSLAMLMQSNVLLIRTWLEQLPRELVQTRPRLILAFGWTLVLTGRWQTAEQWLASPPASTVLQSSDLPANVTGELTLLQATMARFQGDHARVLELARQVLGYLSDKDQGLRAGAMFTIGTAQLNLGDIAAASRTLAETARLSPPGEAPYITLIALQELGEIQFRQGQLSQLLQTCQQTRRMVTRWEGRPIPAAGMADIYLGELLYEWNDLEGARQALIKGTDLLQGSIEQYLLAQGYVALARVQQAQGDREGAFATLQRGEAWFTQMQVADVGAGALLALSQARLWLEQGQWAAASRWAQHCQWRAEETSLGHLQRLTLVRLRLAQSQDNPPEPLLSEARQELNQLLALAEAGGWWSRVIQILALQARVYQAQGEVALALASLERALTLAEPEGYIRTFVDEGGPMAELLQQARSQGIAPDYVSKLLDNFPNLRFTIYDLRLENSPSIQNSLVEPLTEREMELLRLVATGRSNQEIGQELYLAVGTVKKHLNNIFGKLEVSSRTQAVARAREIGLL